MPKYRYIVVNQENNQLNGTIGAPDEKSARQELNELGFSVVSIQEMTDEEQAPSAEAVLPTFEFAAIDKNQKHIVGTIQSTDRFNAYKRLVTEYALEVEYLINNNLTEEQKVKERKKGIYDLQDMLSEEEMVVQKKESSDEKDMKEFERKQDILKSQIDFVLNKVREMLDLYEKNMKPETKENIRRRVDKILRIKTSTNLDYVRKTAEELLSFLQKEEIFLNEEAQIKERTKMVVEAKSMMMQLRRGKAKTSLSFTDQLRRWRQEHIVDNPSPTFADKALNMFASIFIGYTPESAEILAIRQNILVVNDQIWQYLQLYFQSPNPEFKAETKEGLRKLFNERKSLKKKLKETKKMATAVRKKMSEETPLEKFSKEMLSFSGWLLTFYLIYYFISIYAVSKDLGLPEIPPYFYIYRSEFLKYFLSTLFLFHGALSVKINFFKRNEIATLVITPIFLLSSVIIYLNF